VPRLSLTVLLCAVLPRVAAAAQVERYRGDGSSGAGPIMPRLLTRHPDRSVRTVEMSIDSSSATTALGEFEWCRDMALHGRMVQVGVKYDHARGVKEGDWRKGIKQVKLSPGVLELLSLHLTGECTHCFEKQSTAIDLSMAAPGGTLFGAACDVLGTDSTIRVTEVSAFHRAGPVNIMPRWLTRANVLRLHVGRGGTFRRCPVSMQVDIPLSAESTAEVELKMRRKLGPGRLLRTVWLASKGALLMEYEDSATDHGAVWLARARTPLNFHDEQPRLAATQFCIRRKWHW